MATKPVMAQCYAWDLASDTVTAYLTTDAGGNYDLDNVTSPFLMFQGRTGTKGDFDGLLFSLGANISLACFELLDSRMVAAELVRIDFATGTPYTPPTNRVVGTDFAPATEAEIFTAHSFKETAPTRANWVLGYDNFSVSGPTPASPPAVAPLTVRSGRIDWKTSAGGAYWDLGYFALGINAYTLAEEIDASAIHSDRRLLQSNSYGYRCSIRWDLLKLVDAVAISSFWAQTEGGDWPCFFFPAAGQKTTSGTLTNAIETPVARGGLVRLLSWGYDSSTKVGTVDHAVNATLEYESWQEDPME